MSTRIFVMTHKGFDVPKNPMYVPIHVGRAAWKPIPISEYKRHPERVWESEQRDIQGEKRTDSDSQLMYYQGDDTGDNISEKNCYYSELTGHYWVWKNVHDTDIIGCCHYRRYLINHQGYAFTEEEIEEVLKSHDLITTKRLVLNDTYYNGFLHHHKKHYLDVTEAVIKEIYPEYYPLYEKLVHEEHTYFANMLIMKKSLYDKYMEWLFAIFDRMERQVIPVADTEEDSYHRRIFGFISEFLLYVWVNYNKLSVYECMVGMVGEKAETREVRQQLREFFKKRDYKGAKAFFLQEREKRPDIMMEASDVTGELHLCMQIIATADLEQQQFGTNLLDRMNDYQELMKHCNRLNHYTIEELKNGELSEEGKCWMKNEGVTDIAHLISRKMYE